MTQHNIVIGEIESRGMTFKVVVDLSTDEEKFSAHVIFSRDGAIGKSEEAIWEYDEPLPPAPTKSEIESLME